MVVSLFACGVPEEAQAEAEPKAEAAAQELTACQWYGRSLSPGEIVLHGPIAGWDQMRCPSFAFQNTRVHLDNMSNVNWTRVRVSAGFWYQEFDLRPRESKRFDRFYAGAPITLTVISPNAAAALTGP